MESIGSLFWLLIILISLQPALRRKVRQWERLKVIGRLEEKRNSRLIVLIHHQETLALLGFPFFRYIDINDSEQVIRAIRLTDDAIPIEIILHTPGGLVLPSLQIAQALERHPAKTRAIVPHHAMSGGTLIALAADEIVMADDAVLGPVDPQVGRYPAVSVLRVLHQKPPERIDDETYILADQAEKALSQTRSEIEELLSKKMDLEAAKETAAALSEGNWTHDHPISPADAKALGLPVTTDFPTEFFDLMDMYPQPVRRVSSVEYSPGPRSTE
ncbi:MAG: hypothetical protein ABFS14_00640 [Gemmatimonadota bacterium]